MTGWDVFAVAGRLWVVLCAFVAIGTLAAVARSSRAVDSLTVDRITSAPQLLGRCESCAAPTAFRLCLDCACGVCGGFSRGVVCLACLGARRGSA